MPTIPDRYRLSMAQYKSIWEPIQKKVFRISESNTESPKLPSQVFKNGFDFAFINSGYHIIRDDFLALKRALKKLGGNHFVMIETDHGPEANIRLKYPSDISLSKYTPYQNKVDNDIQFVVENFPFQFYLFGKRDDWGIYSSEPHDIIIGFKDDAKKAFENLFVTNKEEVLSWLKHEIFAEFREKFCANYL